jgi:YesN/AraC family two-component response regulator
MPTPLRRQILVVDDDPNVRAALHAALADGYVVHSASTGTEALAILQAQPVAVILLDAILTREHGLDLVPRIRKHCIAPILLITGHSSEELAIRALNAHVDGYLKKPVDLAALRTAVQHLLGGSPPDPADQVRTWLEAHCGKPLRLAALAGQFGVSDRHLRRLFRAAYGQTPQHYLAEYRMQRARNLLRDTSLRIKRVAAEVGYPTLLGFRRAFRRRFGIPPAACRADGRK